VDRNATPEGGLGIGPREPAPGVYWVVHSVEFRAQIDKIHTDCHLNPVPWRDSPFIAEWCSRYSGGSYPGWFVIGDERDYEPNEITVIAGPLVPPIQSPGSQEAVTAGAQGGKP
jgi:hypothetical protein